MNDVMRNKILSRNRVLAEVFPFDNAKVGRIRADSNNFVSLLHKIGVLLTQINYLCTCTAVKRQKNKTDVFGDHTMAIVGGNVIGWWYRLGSPSGENVAGVDVDLQNIPKY
jgi:hypothetical protein